MIKQAKQVVYDPMEIRSLCTRPYPNHPHGCPNYGIRATCPPTCRWFFDVYYRESPVYVIWTKFNLEHHVNRMRERHPDWSYRQLSCCLYWQGTARKYHREEVERFKLEYPRYTPTSVPEGMGVDVTNTMRIINEHLEWPPRVWTYQVSLAGIRRE